jgi:hypothetical protein
MTKNYFDHYNTLANNKDVSRADVYTRCIIKAIRAKSEDKVGVAIALLKKAFTKPTNPTKVANGALQYWGINHARYEASLKYRYLTKEYLTEAEQGAWEVIFQATKGVA